MISFKTKDDALPSALMLAALALLVGSLAFMLFVPRPTTKGLATGKERSRKKLEAEIAQAKARSAEAEAKARPLLWSGKPEKISADVLALLNAQATQKQVQLGSFRPQRTQLLPGALELPYSVQVTGPFPAVRALAQTLDATGGRLALRSIQLAASDGESSNVTATLGISAFTAAPEETSPDAKKSSGGSRG